MTEEEKVRELQQKLLYFKERSELDLLTGLYNRMSFESYVSQKLEEKEAGYFLMIDVDNFKGINDLYGHLAGDIVLERTAGLLREVFPATSVIGRMGGDEFAVHVSEIADMEVIETMVGNMIAGFRQTAEEICPDCVTNCSVGITQIHGHEAFRSVYQRSDMAMYKAKKSSREFCWYET